MSINEREWSYERERLAQVMAEIRRQLEDKKESTEGSKGDLIATRKEMWENISHSVVGSMDLENIVQAQQYLNHIHLKEKKYQFYDKLVKKLERMYQSPYFGRMDFREEGEEDAEKFYIGISNLNEEESGDLLVYDWRAPVSGMFYDYETGQAKYDCPACTIEGEITLKRQYRISDGKIEYMFDSSLKIDDEVLQELLSKSVDNRMKTIITSIQREQNKIIRDDEHRLLIVQGAAGSGKTSIALHRIAYLLYRYRNSITADNIVIFSPNDIFNDYISAVLPELGEENMYQTTFGEYARSFLDRSYRLETMTGHMEYLLTCHGQQGCEERLNGIAYKGSQAFSGVLRRYVKYLEEMGYSFESIEAGDRAILSREEIEELFYKDYVRLPLAKRLDKVRQRIFYVMQPYEKEREKQILEELIEGLASAQEYMTDHEMKGRARLAAMEELRVQREKTYAMTELNVYRAYRRLFEDRELFASLCEERRLPDGFEGMRKQTLAALEQGFIPYEDVSPLLFLKGEFGDLPNTSDIKHVIVDEAQDYTPLQYEIFRQLFPNTGMTLLGDLNQSINAYMNVGRYEAVADIFKGEATALLRLTRSYRSTREITAFTKGLLKGGEDIDYINREGDKPRLIYGEKEERIFSAIAEDMKNLSDRGYKSIALICKTAAESRRVYDRLRGETDIKLMTGEDGQFTRGLVVVPSYLAKGLEFDAVLVFGADRGSYHREEERKLFYTACTRALHQLYLYYTGEPTPFIAEADSRLFDRLELK